MILILKHAAQVVCVARQGEMSKPGRQMQDLAIIPDGAVVIRDDIIHWVGPTSNLPHTPADAQVIDASGNVIIPGLVDGHTHLVYAGDRVDEFQERLRGTSYQEIAARGGGIMTTVRAVRQASKQELKELTRRRLDQMLALGITTVEIKSGYGLTFEDEIKCLEVVAELQREHPCTLVPTFLGAHEVPTEHRAHRRGYIDLLTQRMIPEVAGRGLARYCDVFCEQGVFDVKESEEILLAARDRGLGVKVHADEFSSLGGAELAARLGAVSADHLLQITDAGIAALQQSRTIATLLPGTAFFLGVPYAPARRLIEAGLPVALATDCNPGSCPTLNLPLVGTLACTQMKMLPAEVLTAMTLNGAAAVGLSYLLGSIETGKHADLVVCDVVDYRQLFYEFGINHVRKVIKAGRVVVGANAGA